MNQILRYCNLVHAHAAAGRTDQAIKAMEDALWHYRQAKFNKMIDSITVNPLDLSKGYVGEAPIKHQPFDHRHKDWKWPDTSPIDVEEPVR